MGNKIGILTINDYSNYGNRLQNYALQEALKDLGCDVETIVQDRENLRENLIVTSEKTVSERIVILFSISNKEKIRKIKERFEVRISRKYRTKKVKNLRKFTDQFIKEASQKISINNIPNSLDDEYDCFITGSDQVWNPNFSFGNEIDFLTFASKKKRISYAASFGISSIPDKYIEEYKERLFNMNKISVREEAGLKIVRDLTGKEATVLVDPTLLIEKDRWKSIMIEHSYKPKKKYLLTYMLGDFEESSKKYIKQISKEKNLEVVNLGSYKDRKRYDACPAEFIDYFNSAEIVVTNSFHGAVFSILLEKAFIVLGREGLNSRIDTLLKKFKLENRKLDNVMKKSDVFQVDFSHVQAILDEERNKAYTYLKDALEIKDAK